MRRNALCFIIYSEIIKKVCLSPDTVVHICNSSYSGGRDQRIAGVEIGRMEAAAQLQQNVFKTSSQLIKWVCWWTPIFPGVRKI
jgi:hypothetical protein